MGRNMSGGDSGVEDNESDVHLKPILYKALMIKAVRKQAGNNPADTQQAGNNPADTQHESSHDEDDDDNDDDDEDDVNSDYPDGLPHANSDGEVPEKVNQ